MKWMKIESVEIKNDESRILNKSENTPKFKKE